MPSRKYLLVTVVILLVQVGLVACGDETATPPVAGTVSQVASPGAKPLTTIGSTSASASSLASSPTPDNPTLTTAVKTPLIASGLKKGTLKEVFPVLAGLISDVKTIKIKIGEGGMGGIVSKNDDYKLNRVGQDFKGLGLYESGYFIPSGLVLEDVREISIASKEASAFFEQLGQVPVEEGSYTSPPIPTMTDYSHSLLFEIETQSGTLYFESNSQKDDFFPWTVNFGGRIFTTTDASPFQAYQTIKPSLKTEINNLLDSQAFPLIGTTQPPNPLPPTALNPLVQTKQGQFKSSNLGIVRALTFNSATSTWAVSLWRNKGQVQLFDQIGQPGKILATQGSPLAVIAFSLDGKYLAASDRDFGSNKGGETAVEVWEVASGRQIAHLTGHERGVSALAFSGDGHTLVSASTDRTVRVWSLPDGKNTAVLQDKLPDVYSFLSVAISQDGKRVAAAGRGDVVSGYFPIKVWELGKNSVETTLKGHSYYITTLDFSPDGRTLVSADEKGDLKLWDSQTWQIRASWSNSPALLVNSLAVSPDSRTLATTHHAGDLRLWDMATLRPLSVTIAATPEKSGYWTSVRAFFSADGKTIVTGDLENATFSQWAVNP